MKILRKAAFCTFLILACNLHAFEFKAEETDKRIGGLKLDISADLKLGLNPKSVDLDFNQDPKLSVKVKPSFTMSNGGKVGAELVLFQEKSRSAYIFFEKNKFVLKLGSCASAANVFSIDPMSIFVYPPSLKLDDKIFKNSYTYPATADASMFVANGLGKSNSRYIFPKIYTSFDILEDTLSFAISYASPSLFTEDGVSDAKKSYDSNLQGISQSVKDSIKDTIKDITVAEEGIEQVNTSLVKKHFKVKDAKYHSSYKHCLSFAPKLSFVLKHGTKIDLVCGVDNVTEVINIFDTKTDALEMGLTGWNLGTKITHGKLEVCTCISLVNEDALLGNNAASAFSASVKYDFNDSISSCFGIVVSSHLSHWITEENSVYKRLDNTLGRSCNSSFKTVYGFYYKPIKELSYYLECAWQRGTNKEIQSKEKQDDAFGVSCGLKIKV